MIIDPLQLVAPAAFGQLESRARTHSRSDFCGRIAAAFDFYHISANVEHESWRV